MEWSYTVGEKNSDVRTSYINLVVLWQNTPSLRLLSSLCFSHFPRGLCQKASGTIRAHHNFELLVMRWVTLDFISHSFDRFLGERMEEPYSRLFIRDVHSHI